MQSDHELSTKGEECWRELQTHLEWSEKFELFILFTDNPLISKIIRERTNLIFANNQTPIHYFEPQQPDTLIADVFDFLRPLENEHLAADNRSPIWLEVSQWSEQWAPVQKALIERINERRDRLRKYHPQPLVIVMNGDFSQELRTIAPDLWSVRCYSRILASDFILLPKEIGNKALVPSPTGGQLIESLEKIDDIYQHPKIIEWQRLVDNNAQGIDVVWAGIHAFNIAFDHGYIQLAKSITEILLVKARQLDKSPESLRALSASLNVTGRIFEIEKNLTNAEAVFSESLTIRRQLQQLLGDQPQVLRDISVSLDKLGDINQSLGHSNQALAQYSESLTIRRQLQQLLGDQPQAMRDISVSLDNLGDINQSLGHSNQALAQYSESLTLCRKLQQLLGDQPQVLGDISVSLNKLGNINQSLGHSNQALTQFSEALSLAQKQQRLIGSQPQVLQDICELQIDIGKVHLQMSAYDSAKEYFEQSLIILQQWGEITPNNNTAEEWTNWVNEKLADIEQAK